MLTILTLPYRFSKKS